MGDDDYEAPGRYRRRARYDSDDSAEAFCGDWLPHTDVLHWGVAPSRLQT